MTGQSGARPLRVDAARNREAILGAACAAIAEHGADVPLEEIARRAGVGIATLYRRFPTRQDLVAAVFEPRMCAYVRASEAAIANDDPWEGLCGFVREVCAMQAADAGVADVLSRTFPTTAAMDRRLRKATAGLSGVVDAAIASGALRPDFVLEDVILILMANAGIVNVTQQHSPEAWERMIAILLDGLRGPGASQLPPPIDGARVARQVRRAARARHS